MSRWICCGGSGFHFILKLRKVLRPSIMSGCTTVLCRPHEPVVSDYTEQMTTAFDRITVEPGKCGGKPCIRGMRITVRRVLELLATYPDREILFAEYPFLEPEDLQQVLRYAAATVDDERVDIDRVA
jgi:uncharacterized protein (DUF433 family)